MIMLITEAVRRPEQRSFESDEAYAWLEFQNGSQCAFSFIYQRYSDNLYNYGMQLVSNSDLVEDAIQDLFVNLWRCKRNLAAVRSIKFYLLTCLRRGIIKEIRKGKRLVSDEGVLDRKSFRFSRSIEDDLVEDQISRERKMKLNRILGTLSKREREIIYLKFYEDFTYPQIAKHLDLDLKYTYNIASRAFGLIRKYYLVFSCFLSQFCFW